MQTHSDKLQTGSNEAYSPSEMIKIVQIFFQQGSHRRLFAEMSFSIKETTMPCSLFYYEVEISQTIT